MVSFIYMCQTNIAAKEKSILRKCVAVGGQAHRMFKALKTSLNKLSFPAGIMDAAQAGQV